MTGQREPERGWPRLASPDPESLRDEAQRLVAAGLTAVSAAADRIGAPTRERGGAAAAGFDAIGDMLFGPSRHRRHLVANESAECCRCPVCRAIAAAREPAPDLSARLTTGVGDVAAGAARLLRTIAGLARTGDGVRAGVASPTAERPGAAATANPDPWAAATADAERLGAAAVTGHAERLGTAATAETDPWAAATADTDPWAAATAETDPWAAATAAAAPDTGSGDE